MALFKKRKVVLVMGGGSARGLCNIGVLKVLEKHFGRDNMPFDMIVGTSIGSLIGASYSLGMTPEELEKRTSDFNWQSLVDLGLYSTGLIKGDKLESLIRECIGDHGFEDMKTPFALTTTDIETGEELTHTSGNLTKLIRASCSWPGIFSAVNVGGRLLVDGGVRNSVPTKAAIEAGATFILAVNPGFATTKNEVNNVMKAFVQSIQIMGEELNSYQSEAANIVIKPPLKNINQFDFDKAEYIIREGEMATEEKIKRIKSKLGRIKHFGI